MNAENLRSYGIKNASEVGCRVAELLNDWTGLHHIDRIDKINWSDPICIRIDWGQPLDTFDFDRLTKLVFLAHHHCIRVQVTGKPGPYRDVQIMFHARDRDGSMCKRHPTLQQAVASFHEKFNEGLQK